MHKAIVQIHPWQMKSGYLGSPNWVLFFKVKHTLHVTLRIPSGAVPKALSGRRPSQETVVLAPKVTEIKGHLLTADSAHCQNHVIIH